MRYTNRRLLTLLYLYNGQTERECIRCVSNVVQYRTRRTEQQQDLLEMNEDEESDAEKDGRHDTAIEVNVS